ncbi:hypothetical protein [Reyranella sp.]|uniref:hypothetical protein n=1 Tax=Reyranella sp. TaxID=1929291 RepID=UPI0040367282
MSGHTMSDDEWNAMTDQQWLQHRLDRCTACGWTANKERYERILAAFSTSSATDADLPAWRPMATAPRDGSPFWGKVGSDAIRMLWHDEFKAFVSSWNQMQMHNGWTFDDGSTVRNHSPVKHEPEAWMPMPEGSKP